jgi:hypothetical protein
MGIPSSTSNGPNSQSSYIIGGGTTSSDPFITVFMTRNPTANDVNYPIKKRWINISIPSEWILQNYTNISSPSNPSGQTQANWIEIANGTSGVIINGDSGFISGDNLTIYANNALQNCGSSVEFVNSGTISTLHITDSNQNTFIGAGAGNLSITGNSNTSLGYASLERVTTGSGNVAIGALSAASITSGNDNVSLGLNALEHLTTGTNNISIGLQSSNNYTSSEFGNIIIQNIGTTGENNTTRIGTQGTGSGQQNKCFIAGITGVTNSNPAVVTLNTSTGQMGDDTTNFNILSTGLQLKGNNAGTAPPTGFIGEQITSGFVGPSSIGAATVSTLASIVLTPGIWDISAMGYVIATTSFSTLQVAIAPNASSFTGVNFGDNGFQSNFGTPGMVASAAIPAYRVVISTNITYYLNFQITTLTGTATAQGRISAVRVG